MSDEEPAPQPTAADFQLGGWQVQVGKQAGEIAELRGRVLQLEYENSQLRQALVERPVEPESPPLAADDV